MSVNKVFKPRRGTSSGIGSSTVLEAGEMFIEYPSGYMTSGGGQVLV